MFVRPYLRETLTNLESDEEGETVEEVSICVWSGNDKFYKKRRLYIHQNILPGLQMNLGYNKTASVMQIMLQPGR